MLIMSDFRCLSQSVSVCAVGKGRKAIRGGKLPGRKSAFCSTKDMHCRLSNSAGFELLRQSVGAMDHIHVTL